MSDETAHIVDETIIIDECILLYAFRYALGRRTYAVSDVYDALVRNWALMKQCSKDLIKKEIEDARKRDSLGDACDAELWLSILDLW